MNISSVMAELASKLTALTASTGLRVFAFPPDAVHPPAAIVGYPQDITFDASLARGVDRMTVPLYLLVDRNWDATTTEQLSGYLAGAGAASLKALVQTKPHTAFSTARVRSATLDVITVAGVEMWAATLLVDITGPGGA